MDFTINFGFFFLSFICPILIYLSLIAICNQGKYWRKSLVNSPSCYSVQYTRSVMSDSLRPHELQHARPPCPSPTPRVHPNPCHWVCHAIQPSYPLLHVIKWHHILAFYSVFCENVYCFNIFSFWCSVSTLLRLRYKLVLLQKGYIF